MIPKIITQIKDYLIAQEMQLSAAHDDGRINASINEGEVLAVIEQAFKIQIPRSRAWYDFAVEEAGSFFPINIKITDTTHADNLNCKLGIYYALTGLIPDFQNEIKYAQYFEKLKNNLKENNKDYYFLVINKDNKKDVFCNSLKGLQILQPNGNNLPFQCKWQDNRIFQNRNFKEAKSFILRNFGRSIALRAQIYEDFKIHFEEYV
ncbi:hypothetical protein [Hugenholtzia roseola]|uniref:hypothetical protein n=1 Tax=Hugenholtzia roseola TaxID=1002 RepID=UPI00042897A3|nr:hypothetical protein [Hugenholtzia roseola]